MYLNKFFNLIGDWCSGSTADSDSADGCSIQSFPALHPWPNGQGTALRTPVRAGSTPAGCSFGSYFNG